ncbi:aspartate:alanine exchanger family transporter [Arcanobacterium bovis]|uniref:Transporter n=1 Tax=Arcanobacterium bovis TaxID=2529275 RepID=A0A4V2KR48_9ACTO|nr:TrkA C-terminal domain-containing protein [Arcanobacterium bovis]TBW22092.1 transporter [Arcanobacterium bovis]
MGEILQSSPLLTVFLVVSLGAALGIIPFGPIKLGAAGALFVGLFVGNIVPELGGKLALVQSLGLGLFVYTVGLSAGQTFFADLRKQAKLMLGLVFTLVIGAIATIVGGKLLGLAPDMAVGVFAGALTTTPALAAATQATHSGVPGVGYSLGYPVGVIVAIIAVSMVVSRRWEGKNDVESFAGKSLFAGTALVKEGMSIRSVPGWKEQKIRVSYLERADVTRIFVPGEELLKGDRIVIVGMESDVEAAASAVGELVDDHLADYRAKIDFRSFVVSAKEVASKTVAALNVTGRFGGVITRIHRGDLELLAQDNSVIELGDRLMVAFPREEYDAVERFFGNSERQISQVDAIAMGLGMVLGLLLGMVEISLPSGSTFSLGAAAGPLIVGTILGALQKTGPLMWQMPQAANQTIRQLGLLLFLAAVGIASGPAFAKTAFTETGLLALILAFVIAVIVLLCAAVVGKLLGVSAQRTAGAMAGVLGQPAVLAFAASKEHDERIESGYAAIFALGITVKIILVTVIVAFA